MDLVYRDKRYVSRKLPDLRRWYDFCAEAAHANSST
jgi:hypothetical protein